LHTLEGYLVNPETVAKLENDVHQTASVFFQQSGEFFKKGKKKHSK